MAVGTLTHTEVYATAARIVLTAGGEERLEERGGFFREDAGGDFDTMIQARMREDFETRADGATARIVGTVDEFRNAGLDHGAGTHRAGLERDVHRGARKTIVG